MPIITWIDGLRGGEQPRFELMKEGPEWIFAHQSPVKEALRREALSVTVRARALLAIVQARTPGTSTWIEMTGPTQGHYLDYKVHLFSERGSRAAHAIEFGHTGVGVPRKADIYPFQIKGRRYEGAFILKKAAGGNLTTRKMRYG